MLSHAGEVVSNVNIWNKRIRHINVQRMNLIQIKGINIGQPKFRVDNLHKVCEACIST